MNPGRQAKDSPPRIVYTPQQSFNRSVRQYERRRGGKEKWEEEEYSEEDVSEGENVITRESYY